MLQAAACQSRASLSNAWTIMLSGSSTTPNGMMKPTSPLSLLAPVQTEPVLRVDNCCSGAILHDVLTHVALWALVDFLFKTRRIRLVPFCARSQRNGALRCSKAAFHPVSPKPRKSKGARLDGTFRDCWRGTPTYSSERNAARPTETKEASRLDPEVENEFIVRCIVSHPWGYSATFNEPIFLDYVLHPSTRNRWIGVEISLAALPHGPPQSTRWP